MRQAQIEIKQVYCPDCKRETSFYLAEEGVWECCSCGGELSDDEPHTRQKDREEE